MEFFQFLVSTYYLLLITYYLLLITYYLLLITYYLPPSPKRQSIPKFFNLYLLIEAARFTSGLPLATEVARECSMVSVVSQSTQASVIL